MCAQKKRKSSIDLQSLIKLYKSKWYIFLASVIFCCGIAFLYTKIHSEVFQVRANILISQDESLPSLSSTLNEFSGGLLASNPEVEDEVFIVSSHSVLHDVVKDMQLNKVHYINILPLVKRFRYLDFPVDVVADNPTIADTLATNITFRVKVKGDGDINVKVKTTNGKLADIDAKSFPIQVKTIYGTFTVNKTKDFITDEPFKTTITFMGYHGAAEAIAKKLHITVANKRANVITLSTDHPNTDYSRDLLNAIIAKYNLRYITENNIKGQKTNDFIDKRLESLAGELSTSESEIESYKKDHDVVDLGAETTYQMGKKGKIESALLEAMTEQEILKMTRDFITDPANNYSIIPAFQGTGAIGGALDQYNKLILGRISLMQDAQGDNAQLKTINDQLDAMRKSINVTLQKEYQNSVIKTRELQSEYSTTDSRLEFMPSFEKVFRDMKRQQSVKEQLYVFLLRYREENAMMMANTLPKGQIVDEAYALVEPVGLSKKILLALAFILGLLLPNLWFYMRKSLRYKFATKQDVESVSTVPIIGEVCEDKTGDTMVVTASSNDITTEYFRLVRANLQFVLDKKNDKAILVTSTLSGEGKTFIAINMASSISLLGRKVLLVDMDIRNPKVAENLGLNARYGLTEYLASDSVDIDNIIERVNGFDVIAAGPIPPNPSELLLSDRVDKLFEQLRERYDVIIIDSAPVGSVSDTYSLSRISDATIYVCRANFTPIKTLSQINELHADNRLKKMSLLVNGTAPSDAHYGYGDNHKKK